MEALRLQGNALFATDPQGAAACYRAATDLYVASLAEEDEVGAAAAEGSGGAAGSVDVSLEEYTKSAGNLLTCLYKYDKPACAAAARAALQVNPLLAKANAFLGRCLLDEATGAAASDSAATTDGLAGYFARQAAYQYLCRAIYQLPALEATARPYVAAALSAMMDATAAGTVAAAASAAPAPDEGDECPADEFGGVIRVVESGDGSGKEVVAAAALPAGTVVSSLLRPFSVGPYEESGGRGCCAHCACLIDDEEEEESGGGGGCERCGLVHYCGAECRAAHSARHAAYECALLLRLRDMTERLDTRALDVPSDFFEIAAHTVTTVAAYQHAHDRGRGPETHAALLSMVSHATEVAQAQHPAGALLEELFAGGFGSADAAQTPPPPPPLLVHVMGALRCNAVEVCGAGDMGVAQVLHVSSAVSRFNHSCSPNCCLDGGAARCVATTRPVAAGEPLTIAYMPELYWPTALRREHLELHYFFTCRCPRCRAGRGAAALVDDAPFERATRAPLPTAAPGAADRHQRAVLAFCHDARQRPAEAVAAGDVRRGERLLGAALADLFPFHFLCHEARNALTYLYAASGDRRRCAASALAELLMWEATVPGALPVKRLKLANIRRCLDDEDDDDDAREGGQVAKAERAKARESDPAWAAVVQSPLYPHLDALYRLYLVE